MTIRQMRSMLWAAGSVLGGFAVGSLILGWRLPYDRAATGPAMNRHASLPAGTGSTSAFTLVELQHAAQIDLRRPLYDAARAPPPPPPAPAPLTVRLTGTLVEPGHSRAILVGPDGHSALKAVGESMNGAEVLEIGQDSVSLRYDGNTVTLTVPKRPPAP